MQLQELRGEPLLAATPAGFSLDQVVVRLVRPDERIKWDELMDQHHYLGFKRFAGRGLRYVAEWGGRWIALAGWQAAALKCAPRDRWIGWRGKKMFKRLHLIANNTRFLVLGERGVLANLASCMMSAMLRRLSDDWQEQYGHPLLVGGELRRPGTVQRYHVRGGELELRGQQQGLCAQQRSLHRPARQAQADVRARVARRRARDPAAAWESWPTAGRRGWPAAVGDEVDKRSLYEELQRVPDHRRGQGRKHSLATVLAVYLLAMLSNMRGPVAAAEYAQALEQEELKLLGAWRNRATGRYEPPTKSTIHRVVMATDAEALEAMQQRYATARVPASGAQEQRQALAADGKRIRGANRNGTMRYETATLVEHRTGVPVASLNFHDQNGELAAVGALLEVVPISGAVITLDALHTTRDTTVSIVEQHGGRLSSDRQGELFGDLRGTCQHAVGGRCRALLRGPAEGPWAYRPAPYRGAHPARQDAQLCPCRAGVPGTSRAHRPEHRGQEHRVRLRHHLTGRHLRDAAATAGLESRPLGDRVEEPSSPRQDAVRRRLYGTVRLLASQPCDLQQHRTGADPAPPPVGQRRAGPALLHAAPERSLQGAAGARLRRPQRTTTPSPATTSSAAESCTAPAL